MEKHDIYSVYTTYSTNWKNKQKINTESLFDHHLSIESTSGCFGLIAHSPIKSLSFARQRRPSLAFQSLLIKIKVSFVNEPVWVNEAPDSGLSSAFWRTDPVLSSAGGDNKASLVGLKLLAGGSSFCSHDENLSVSLQVLKETWRREWEEKGLFFISFFCFVFVFLFFYILLGSMRH